MLIQFVPLQKWEAPEKYLIVPADTPLQLLVVETVGSIQFVPSHQRTLSCAGTQLSWPATPVGVVQDKT